MTPEDNQGLSVAGRGLGLGACKKDAAVESG